MGPELKINTNYSSYPSRSPTSANSTSRFDDTTFKEYQEFNEVMPSNKSNSNLSKFSNTRSIDSYRTGSERGRTLPSSPPLAGGDSFDSGVISERVLAEENLDGLGIDSYVNSSPINDYLWEKGHTSQTSSISTASISPTLSRRNISPLVSYGFQSPSSATSSHSPLISISSDKDRHTPPKMGIVKKIWYKYKLLSRNSNRLVKFFILLFISFSVWFLVFRTTVVNVKRVKLTTKWWEKDAIAVTLYPRPLVPSAPKLPATIISISHTLVELSKLPSSFTPSAPFEYTAFLHIHTNLEVTKVPILIESLKSQSILPESIVILSPENLEPSPYSVVPTISSKIPISFFYYPTTQPSALAIIESFSAINTPYSFVVMSTSVGGLERSYVENLLKVAGTKEYSNSLLSNSGLYYSSSATDLLILGVQCQPTATNRHSSHQITVPTSPFLIETSSFSHITNGLRLDLDPLVAISLALVTQRGVIGFRIPFQGDTTTSEISNVEVERKCKDLIRNFGGESVLNLFRNTSIKSRSRYSNANPDLSITTDNTVSKGDGSIVLLLSGEEELQLAHSLACKISQRHDIRVYVSDLDVRKYSSSSRIFFSPLTNSTNSNEEIRCHLDIVPLTTSSKSLQALMADEFDRLEKVEVVIYLADGTRAEEFSQVLKLKGGYFGRDRERKDNGMVVIPLNKAEVGLVDWISALPMEAIRHWHTPRIDISVITNNRPTSLSRLLNSLHSAHYLNDDVSLTINLEQTTDRITQKLVHSFEWNYGRVNLRHRIVMGGLMQAIVESWYPTSLDNYGVLLEDDVEVSPLFYSWLKFTILYYRYSNDQKDQSKRLFGISLYQQKNIELRPEGRQPFDAHTLLKANHFDSNSPYLSQVPCSWGSVFFPQIWIEFHSYLSLRLSETTLSISESIVPKIRSNNWPRSWKKYFIELIFLRGYVMLYPNYENFESFSTNHLEKGTHIHVKEMDEKRKSQFEVPLMGTNSTSSNSNLVLSGLPEQKLPSWNDLPFLDLWGAISTGNDLIERGWQSLVMLDSCPIIDLKKDLTFDARELLCKKVYDSRNSRGRKVSSEQDEGVVRRPLEIRTSNLLPLLQHPSEVALSYSNEYISSSSSLPLPIKTSIPLAFVEEPLQVVEPLYDFNRDIIADQPRPILENVILIDAEKLVVEADDEEWDGEWEEEEEVGSVDHLTELVVEEVATVEDVPAGKERYEIELEHEKKV